jgi:hypothetical protein
MISGVVVYREKQAERFDDVKVEGRTSYSKPCYRA